MEIAQFAFYSNLQDTPEPNKGSIFAEQRVFGICILRQDYHCMEGIEW